MTAEESARVFSAECPRFINAVNGASSPVLAEWDMARQVVSVACRSQAQQSRSKLQYPVLKTFILVHRQWKYHLGLIIIPLLGILALSLLTFQLDEKKYDRYVALVALIFPAFQLKTQVAELLPHSGRFTILDVLVLLACYFVLWVVALNFMDAPHFIHALLGCRNTQASLLRSDYEIFKHFFYNSDEKHASLLEVLLRSWAVGSPLPPPSDLLGLQPACKRAFKLISYEQCLEKIHRHVLDYTVDQCDEKFCFTLCFAGIAVSLAVILFSDSFKHASQLIFRPRGAARSPSAYLHIPDSQDTDVPEEPWPTEASFGASQHTVWRRIPRALKRCFCSW